MLNSVFSINRIELKPLEAALGFPEWIQCKENGDKRILPNCCIKRYEMSKGDIRILVNEDGKYGFPNVRAIPVDVKIKLELVIHLQKFQIKP